MISTHLQTLAAIAKHLEDTFHNHPVNPGPHLRLKTSGNDNEISISSTIGTIKYKDINWLLSVDDDKIDFRITHRTDEEPDFECRKKFELADPKCFDQITEAITEATALHSHYQQIQKTHAEQTEQFNTNLKTYKRHRGTP